MGYSKISNDHLCVSASMYMLALINHDLYAQISVNYHLHHQSLPSCHYLLIYESIFSAAFFAARINFHRKDAETVFVGIFDVRSGIIYKKNISTIL